MATGNEGVHSEEDDDWSFLDGSPVIEVYNETYIATDDSEPDAQWYSSNSQQTLNSAAVLRLSAASLAILLAVNVVCRLI